jgi:hypothetical protein
MARAIRSPVDLVASRATVVSPVTDTSPVVIVTPVATGIPAVIVTPAATGILVAAMAAASPMAVVDSVLRFPRAATAVVTMAVIAAAIAK